MVHTSDVQGPIYDATKKYILDENPDILILSGPPIYLVGFALSKEDVERARSNLVDLCREISQVVVDHHFRL